MRGKNFLRHVSRSDNGRYLDSIAFFQPDEKDALYTADVRRALLGSGSAKIALARHFERFASLPPHSRMMRFDFETYLPEDVLTKVDRMSMAHSIESRVPLLDNEVIEFASTLPASLKIVNGRRKHVLKEAARRLLPAEILDRKKQGFGVPLGVWFRGGLTDVFSDVLRVAADAPARLFRAGVRRPPRRGAPLRQARPHAAPVAAAGLRALAPAVHRYAGVRRRLDR